MRLGATNIPRRVRLLFVATGLGAGVFAVLGLILIALNRGAASSSSSTASKDKTHILTGVQIAEKVGAFLFAKHPTSFEWKECYSSGACIEVPKRSAPDFAWNMRAASALLRTTGSEKYRKILDENFTALKKEPAGGPFRLVVPLIESYASTKDPSQLDMLFSYASYLLNSLRHGLDREKIPGHPMNTATEAREMALMFELLGNDAVRGSLEAKNAVFSPTLLDGRRADFLKAAKTSLAASERADENSELVLSAFKEFHQFSCYVQLTRMELFRVTRDKRHFDDISRFFSRADFISRSPNDFQFVAISQILPCIETLQLMAKEEPRYSTTASTLIKKFLLPSWDFEGRKICNGDNGFFAVMAGHKPECGRKTKTNSDNAYAAFLFAQRAQQSFIVR